MLSDWPMYTDQWNFPEDEAMVERVKDLVKGVRNLRKDMDVPNSRKAKLLIVSDSEEVRKTFETMKDAYQTLAYASEISVLADASTIPADAVSVVIPDAVVYLPLEDLVDMEKEKERLTKELARSKGMLSNEKFLSRAPEAKVAEEKAKLEKYQQMMDDVNARLAQMK